MGALVVVVLEQEQGIAETADEVVSAADVFTGGQRTRADRTTEGHVSGCTDDNKVGIAGRVCRENIIDIVGPVRGQCAAAASGKVPQRIQAIRDQPLELEVVTRALLETS